MKARARFVAALAVIAAVAVAVPLAAAGPSSRAAAAVKPKAGQVVGYFIEWGIYGRSYFVKNVETSGAADELTVINYAFGNVAPDNGKVTCQIADSWADYQRPWGADESVNGEAVPWGSSLRGNFQQLRALKALHPDLKVLISIGGWTFSKYFSDAALTKESRKQFVSSCIDLFIKGNLPGPVEGDGSGGPGAAAGVFDGIDVDWEWPGSEGNAGNIIRPEDKQNFTKLMQEFRKQLHEAGKQAHQDYLLTAFLPASPAKIDAGFEVPDIFGALTFGTTQGYDFHGPWESSTNHQSNLYTSPSDPTGPAGFSDDQVVNAYLSRGAPAKELVVGVPFYSHGWTGVNPANHGLYQAASGAAPGTWEAGSDDYKAVKALLGQGFTRYEDSEAGAAWVFDGTTFWTFDDPPVMTAKAEYARQNGLGGIMFWELSGDTPDGELIHAVADGLQ